jgi:hypothetical protein
MNSTGDEFFTRSAFAVNRDGARQRRYASNHFPHFFDGGALAVDVVQLTAARLVFAQRRVLAFQVALFDGAPHHEPDFVVLKRFGQIVHRSALHSIDRGLDRPVRGDHDRGHMRGVLLHPGQHV